MAGGIDTSAFTDEAYELLSELEESLLELEASPDNQDLIGRVFRAMHTIKGSGAMFGFDDVASFTHEVETVFDMVRNGVIPVTKELVDLTLAARDQIRAILDAAGGSVPADTANAERIIAGLRGLTHSATDAPGKGGGFDPITIPGSTSTSPANSDIDKLRTFRISFQPQPRIFAFGTNPILLLNELRAMGECRVVAFTETLPSIADLDPESCYTSWDIFLSTTKDENAIRDVFIFVEDECDLEIKPIADDSDLGTTPALKRLGEILVERGSVKADDLDRILHQKQPLGEQLVQAGLVDKGRVQSALIEQELVKQKRQQKDQTEAAGTVRVPAERLDRLVDLVGEMVTVQARLTQTSISLQDHDLVLIAEEVERLTGELRDNTMSIRMLPIGSTFNKFKRLVRDLSNELGKEVEMTTEGGDTELDKTVIDQLNDPLVHIIRNSIDHGVEMPEERKAKGKPGCGNVHLAAEHSGGNVLIRVRDDGKGLDTEKLRHKGIEKGLIPPDAELSERELFNLIFAPGFSTASKITNVSGRGVGMDVVRRSIDNLRGSIDVTSKLGQGTTITLKLPLTLAIIEGLLVKIAEEYFVMPLAAVEECVELSRQDIAKAHGRHIVNVRGEIVPYIRLRDRFEVTGEPPEVEQIVIASVEEQRVGFVVDHVIGQHQTVIKSLGKSFDHSEELSGATILGNGTVALILDLQRMFRDAEEMERAESAA